MVSDIVYIIYKWTETILKDVRVETLIIKVDQEIKWLDHWDKN